MKNHTTEPWEVGNHADTIVSRVNKPTADNVDQHEYYGGNLVAESVKVADRDRIINCVNAFRGIDDPSKVSVRDLIYENGRLRLLMEEIRDVVFKAKIRGDS